MPNSSVPAAAIGLPKQRKTQKPSFVPKPDWIPPCESELVYGVPKYTVTRRELVEATIDRLIRLLDHIDPDADLEPSLGSGGCFGAAVDLEGDSADDEPSLGAPENDGDQRHWSQGGADDREATETIDDLPISLSGLRWRWSARAERAALEETERQLLALAARVRQRHASAKRKGGSSGGR